MVVKGIWVSVDQGGERVLQVSLSMCLDNPIMSMSMFHQSCMRVP